MTVDDELLEFENALWDSLEYHLVVDANWEYWREMDFPPTVFFNGLNLVIADAHAHLIHKYKLPILNQSRTLLSDLAWMGMNVPFPVYPELHATNVCENMQNIWNARIYADLRTEMIMMNHNATVIQRVWKDAVTRPTHPICQRRLLHDYNEFLRDLERLRM